MTKKKRTRTTQTTEKKATKNDYETIRKIYKEVIKNENNNKNKN